MSWDCFDNAKKLIKSAWSSITGSNAEVKTEPAKKEEPQKKSPVSVIRPDGNTVGTVVDEVVVTSKKKVSQKTKTANNNKNKYSITQAEIDKKFKVIENKCRKFGITFEEAQENILKEMNFSMAKFSKLNLEEQYRILSCIEAALSMQILYQNADKFSDDIDKSVFLGKIAANYAEVIKNGGIKDIKKFQARIDTVLDMAYEKFKNAKTDEEKAAILDEAKNNLNQQVEAEYETMLKGKSKEEIAKLEKQKSVRLNKQEEALGYSFLRKANIEERKYVVYTRSGKYMAEAYRDAIDVTKDASKMTVAASQDYKFTNNVLKFKFEHGDNVPADVYGSAIEYSMQFKPENAVKEFEQDAYEYRKKVENGEIDAPWMTSEHFIAQSTAIGVGITSNKNLSTRAKAELLNTWDRHASEFGDYYDIKGAYNKIVEQKSSENGNFAQGVINVKKIMLEDFYNDIEHFPRAWKKRQKHVSVELKQKADSTTLKSELKTKSISEIKNEYSNSISEIARIVLSNDVEYKNRIDDILDYLKAYSGKDIGLMTVGCTTPTISKIIQAFPDKADDILDVVAPTMCYAGKKAVERINNEGNNNAAV